jgi:protein-S-isoprenylcysteine O-methyltransferase Ste14
MNYLAVFTVLAVNLGATLSYFVIINYVKLKEKFYSLPVIIQKMYVFLFVAPLWVSPFIEKENFQYGLTIPVIGGFLVTVCGIGCIIASFRKIGTIPSIASEASLITGSVYSIVRHPIYCGTIITFTGLIILNQSFITAIYLPVSIVLYYLMVVFEEKDLMRIFGNDYKEYSLRVKYRIIPYVI